MTWRPASSISAVSITEAVVTVEHGADTTASRPPAPLAFWKGSATPANATTGDLHLVTDPSGEVVDVQVKSGEESFLQMIRPADTQMITVAHGALSTVARPVGAGVVYWKGSVEPDNGLPGDLWYDTTGDV